MPCADMSDDCTPEERQKLLAAFDAGRAKAIAVPEFMIRVKLPSSGAYHCSPSGDTEYEEAYRNAIRGKLPQGFEVIWPRLNQRNPTDSEGLTWIRIQYDGSKEQDKVSYWIKMYNDLQKEHNRLKEAVKKLPVG